MGRVSILRIHYVVSTLSLFVLFRISSEMMRSTHDYDRHEMSHESHLFREQYRTVDSMVPSTTTPICTSIFALFRNASATTPHPLSPKQVWETLQHDLVQDSITFTNRLWRQQDHPNISTAFKGIMNLLTPDRMHKSLVHPMPLTDSNKLVNIIRLRLDDPAKNPPLRIVAMGGSIVWGMESTSHTFEGLENFKNPLKSTRASWANNLQRVLNSVLFNGLDVVEVKNLGVGGASSDIGALLVEYDFLQTSGTPDVIIAAYATNDEVLGDANTQMEAAQTLVQAVKRLRCDGLPVFISYLDPIMKEPRAIKFMEQGQIQAMLTQWYDFMGISFEKALQDVTMRDIPKIKGKVMSHFDSYNSYWGNPWWNCHPGLIYHSAVSWFITYSLANALVFSCEYAGSPATVGTDQAPLSLNMLPPLRNGADYLELYQQWTQSQMEHDAKCKVQRETGASISKTCAYKWVNTKGLGVNTRNKAEAIMNKVLIKNSGFEAAGGKNKFAVEKPGWITNKANASFEIAVPANNGPIKTVTIIYMKSYGEKWKDSAATVEVRIVRQSGDTEEEAVEPVTLVGTHNSNTSVNYWEAIQLGKGALVGDNVHVTFQMVGGTTFRINGLLFCSN
jgi:hypothetical protein